MGGRHSRNKGANFERELVHMFRDVMPEAEIKRGFQYRGGQEACDVDAPKFWIEAKRHNRTNIKAALRQAMETCPEGRWSLAICKDDRQPAMATMYLDDFLKLVEQWWIGQNR